MSEKKKYPWIRRTISVNKIVMHDFCETCRIKGVKVSPELQAFMERENYKRENREQKKH
jgi:hypothetical protein